MKRENVPFGFSGDGKTDSSAELLRNLINFVHYFLTESELTPGFTFVDMFVLLCKTFPAQKHFFHDTTT